MAKAVSVWRHLCLLTLVVNCFSRSTGIALWCFDSHSLPLRLPARRQITGDRHRAQPGRAFCPMEERWFYNRLSWANEKHHLAYSLAQAKRVLYGSPVCSKPPNSLSKAAKVTKTFSPRKAFLPFTIRVPQLRKSAVIYRLANGNTPLVKEHRRIRICSIPVRENLPKPSVRAVFVGFVNRQNNDSELLCRDNRRSEAHRLTIKLHCRQSIVYPWHHGGVPSWERGSIVPQARLVGPS